MVVRWEASGYGISSRVVNQRQAKVEVVGRGRPLAGSDLRVAHTYLPGDRWSNIEGLPGFLDSWAEWRRDEDDRMFVLNVPMMERNEEGVSDWEVRALLRLLPVAQAN